MISQWCVVISVILLEEVSALIKNEVKSGDTAKLPCLSNDKNHRFQYWQLFDDQIIGPWNNWEGYKYKYEVTTGELTIQKVTSEDSGFYRCISRAMTGPSLRIETVELIVNRGWEEEFEENGAVNTYRALIAFFCFLIVLLFGVLAFLISRRKRSRGNLEETDDSPDEFLSSRQPYKPTTTSFSSEKRKRKFSKENLIADTIDTDMITSFPLPNVS